MSLLEAIVLGITQGITEFLPISSDGHLILVPAILGWQRFGLGFDVVLHAATLMATIAYFRRDVWRLLTGMLSRAEERASDRRLAWFLIAATIPSALIALALEPLVEGVETLPMASQVSIVGGFLLLTGALLGGAEALARRRRHSIQHAEEIPLRHAILIGIAQSFAVAPGLSRSGTTIAAGVALGIRRDEAARFSFLLSIPIVAAATAKKVIIDVGLQGGTLPAALPLTVGLVTTALVGYGAIALLLPFVRRHSLWVFAIYTAIAGTAILVTNVLS
ncbi:MAG: undecaprenyl-diphosphate phosphatase [Coriobacteriia bacterium]